MPEQKPKFHPAQKQMWEAFHEAVKEFFGEAFPVAFFVEPGFGLDFETRVIACEPIIRFTDVQAGHAKTHIRRAVKALVIQAKAAKYLAETPVFRTKPIIEIGGQNPERATWNVTIWCDMGWAPEGAPLTELHPIHF